MAGARGPIVETSRSERETLAIGRRLGEALRAGDVVCLSGELGAGKTAFVRGLAEGLGAPGDSVSSPTFALIQEYRGGRLTLYHADLYRLDVSAAEDLGLEELAVAGGTGRSPGSVLAIEWADRLERDWPGALHVRIERLDDTTRRITTGG